MNGTVRALPIPGHAAAVGVAAGILPDGTLRLYRDRPGNGWAGVELWARGPLGACYPVAILHPTEARALAGRLLVEAARLELAQRERADRTARLNAAHTGTYRAGE